MNQQTVEFLDTGCNRETKGARRIQSSHNSQSCSYCSKPVEGCHDESVVDTLHSIKSKFYFNLYDRKEVAAKKEELDIKQTKTGKVSSESGFVVIDIEFTTVLLS